MQPLNDPPRDVFTAVQVTACLQMVGAGGVSTGLEILDVNDNVTADISDDLSGGTVNRDNYATIHGTCTLNISQNLKWGSVRCRPYMVLTAAGISARWNLGVYILTTPDRAAGLLPNTYSAQGFDKLYFLSQSIGPYAVTAGSDVLTAVNAVIALSGVGGTVLLDNTAAGSTLATDMVWTISNGTVPTFLNVINDLLASIGYRGMWADWNGALRSEPYVNPNARAIEWPFSADDRIKSMVGMQRTQSQDLFPVPNTWIFTQNGVTAPVEGTGQYTVTNQSDGPTSIDAIGFVKRSFVSFDAVDQPTLVSLGDQQVATDQSVTQALKVGTTPFCGAWHFDIYSYLDSALGESVTVQGQSWSLPLDKWGQPSTQMTHVWEVIS